MSGDFPEAGRYTHCPHCGTDLMYTVDGVEYSNAIMVEVRGVYDGGLFYTCPHCDGTWHRWSRTAEFGKLLYDKAELFMKQWARSHSES